MNRAIRALFVALGLVVAACGASPPPAATTSTDEDRDRRDPPKVGTDVDPPTTPDGGARDGAALDAATAVKTSPDAARASAASPSPIPADECAQLVDRVLALIARELGDSGAEVAKMREQLITQCRAKPPTADESRCIAQAATLDDLSKCTSKRRDGLP